MNLKIQNRQTQGKKQWQATFECLSRKMYRHEKCTCSGESQEMSMILKRHCFPS